MQPILISAGVLVVLAFVLLVMFAKFYRKIEQGHALIVNTMRAEPTVTFTGCMVYPIIHKAELMDISLKTVEIDRSGNEGLICRDNIRADIKVKFFVRVNKTATDVLKVAQGIGCARASSQETLEELFSAKFSEALKTVGKSLDFVDLYQARDRFRDEILRQIGDDLSGYVLEDAAIDYLEQTPVNKLDANNILDAQGIKKITELTAVEHVRTNELRRNGEMQIKKKDVETQETMLELERQAADALAKQSREIASVKAREEAETQKIQAEERTKSELARLQAEQAVVVQQENVLREKEVTLQRIDKDRAVEVQKKAIADVVRGRIVVERTVAEQEEAIKELRAVAEADRSKKSTVILAEGQAEEKLVLEVKAAEAQERRARHKAAEELTLADAKLKVAEREAEAKKREAEGLEAITAAPGFAQVKVLKANAEAKLAQMEAEATGKAKIGLAEVQVRAADAEATLKAGQAEAQVVQAKLAAEAEGKGKLGLAEAEVVQAKLLAEAEGKERLGLAGVHVRTADADAAVRVGEAEARNIELRFQAEAKGLREKFDAMKAMSTDTRQHEEFRMALEKQHTETMKGIEAQTSIAREQAEVLGEAMSKAKIDIVGGEGDYFDRFVRALSIGKGIDGVIQNSRTLQVGLKDHLSGERDMVGDLKGLVGALGGSAGELQNLTVAKLLNQVAQNGNEQQKAALATLLQGL